MRILLIDRPAGASDCRDWERVTALGTVEELHDATLTQVLNSARTADVIVSWSTPFKQAVLDYITRPQHIFVPRNDLAHRVDVAIARQLGIAVHGFDDSPTDPCAWIGELLGTVKSGETERSRSI